MRDENEGADDVGVDGTHTVPESDAAPPAILELDHVFEALSTSRRRYLCYTLLESQEWTLGDLATKVAAWETDSPEQEVTSQQRETVYVSLYHVHIPKLVDDGIVTFDEETETIAPGEHTDQVLAVLEGIGASLDASQEAHAREEMDR